MKHLFLIPALLQSAHAEEGFSIKQVLDHSEQKGLLRVLSEDICEFRKEPSLDSPIEIRPSERFDSEEDRRECALALLMIKSRWGILSATELAEYSTKVDFADGRYCLIRCDIGSGAYIPMVVILEYIDHPSKEDSYAVRVIGHYGQSMLTAPTWVYSYAKKNQTFSIRDGAGRLIYQLDLESGKGISQPHTLYQELPK